MLHPPLDPNVFPASLEAAMGKGHYLSAQDFLGANVLRPGLEAPSLAGRRFNLRERTLAIEVCFGGRMAVTIPAGAIIEVVSDSVVSGAINDDQTIGVIWKNRKLEMFRCDVNMRGADIADLVATASSSSK
jgi:hypothetical protein